MLNNIDRYLDLIEEVLLKFRGVIKTEDLKERFYSRLFLCKFFELVYDINVLLKSNRYNSIPILFRAALEVFSDIKGIQNSDGYIDKLGYTASKKEIKRLDNLFDIPEYEIDINFIRKSLDFYENIIFNIPEGRQKEIRVIDKFKNIDKSDLLNRVVYSKLCKESHSNLFELKKHFFKLIDGKPTFIYDVSITDIDEEKFINGIIVTILETIIAAAQINKQDASKYENLLSEFYERKGDVSI